MVFIKQFLWLFFAFLYCFYLQNNWTKFSFFQLLNLWNISIHAILTPAGPTPTRPRQSVNVVSALACQEWSARRPTAAPSAWSTPSARRTRPVSARSARILVPACVVSTHTVEWEIMPPSVCVTRAMWAILSQLVSCPQVSFHSCFHFFKKKVK